MNRPLPKQAENSQIGADAVRKRLDSVKPAINGLPQWGSL